MVSLATFAIWIATASSGDILALQSTDVISLTAGQKTKLAAAVLAVFPTADTSTVQEFYCRRNFFLADENKHNDVECNGAYTKTVSKSAFADLDISGNAGGISAVNGDNVTFLRQVKYTLADANAKDKIIDFASSAFSAVPSLAKLADFICQRKEGAAIDCKAAYFNTLTPEEYVAAKQAGTIIRPLEKVQ